MSNDEMREALEELVDLVKDHMAGGYQFDSFSLQVAEAALTQQPESEPPQVMGRVHHRDSGVVACLNSIGRQLPDNAPLYAGPQPSAQGPEEPPETRS